MNAGERTWSRRLARPWTRTDRKEEKKRRTKESCDKAISNTWRVAHLRKPFLKAAYRLRFPAEPSASPVCADAHRGWGGEDSATPLVR
jgi:hypothetical protein